MSYVAQKRMVFQILFIYSEAKNNRARWVVEICAAYETRASKLFEHGLISQLRLQSGRQNYCKIFDFISNGMWSKFIALILH